MRVDPDVALGDGSQPPHRRATATACFIDAMNTVIVDPHVVAAAPSLARPSVLEPSICRDDALLRSALPFRTRIAMTDNARTDGSRRGGCPRF
jgi:hypothetical protein